MRIIIYAGISLLLSILIYHITGIYGYLTHLPILAALLIGDGAFQLVKRSISIEEKRQNQLENSQLLN